MAADLPSPVYWENGKLRPLALPPGISRQETTSAITVAAATGSRFNDHTVASTSAR
ncbi:MAG TPA: hypothetical protein VMV68_10520 [Spirochaetia bacterium]|nr:hypothetical protein [Spirochaetia bacterium]